MCTRVWFNCTHEKKEICQRKSDIRQTKIKILQKIYEKNCYGPQGSTGTLSEVGKGRLLRTL